MNKAQHDQITKHIEQIDTMAKPALEVFSQKWWLAKEDLDAVVFQWVLRAIDIQFEYLNKKGNFSVMVEMSNFIEGDLKWTLKT